MSNTSHRMPDDAHARVLAERYELRQRITKLHAFISSPPFSHLRDADAADLHEQLSHMTGYETVLNRRITRHNEETTRS